MSGASEDERPRIVIAYHDLRILDKIRRFIARYEFPKAVECRADSACNQLEIRVVQGFEKGGVVLSVETLEEPFRLGRLLELVQALFQRIEEQEVFGFGPYYFDPLLRALTCEDGRVLHLTDREADILRYLLESRGTVVTRDDLLRDIWGYREDLETHTLETHIYRLRQKIEDDPGQPRFIVTREPGYILE